MKLALRVLLAFVAISAVPAPAAPPNVVLIISDDQAWDDYSFMGHPAIKTPRIDRLAAESLTFRRGYVPSSLCSPSLASILTGRYPHQHGVTSNDPPRGGLKTPPGQPALRSPEYQARRAEMVSLFDKNPTLPRLLGEQGYRSFQTGKWWGGNFRHGGFTGGMTHGEPDRGGRHGDEGLTIGRRTMAPATDFIDEAVKDKAPFFLWYAPMMPHSPHNPPERLLAHYRDKAPTDAIAKYWAMIEWFDETVGTLLDHLDAKGLADDTMVIYLADNGWLQDPEADRFAPRSKQSPYEGGLRTPLMVRWQGKVKPRESDRLATSLDIAPTVLAAAGVKAPAGLPGLNLLDDKAVQARDAVFGEIFTHDAVDLKRPVASLRFRWVVAGDWKLIVPNPANEPGAKVELFNLKNDPSEKSDLAATKPELVEKLKQRIQAWWPAD